MIACILCLLCPFSLAKSHITHSYNMFLRLGLHQWDYCKHILQLGIFTCPVHFQDQGHMTCSYQTFQYHYITQTHNEMLYSLSQVTYTLCKPYYTVRYVASYLCVYNIQILASCRTCARNVILQLDVQEISALIAWSTHLYRIQETRLKHQISYEQNVHEMSPIQCKNTWNTTYLMYKKCERIKYHVYLPHEMCMKYMQCPILTISGNV